MFFSLRLCLEKKTRWHPGQGFPGFSFIECQVEWQRQRDLRKSGWRLERKCIKCIWRKCNFFRGFFKGTSKIGSFGRIRSWNGRIWWSPWPSTKSSRWTNDFWKFQWKRLIEFWKDGKKPGVSGLAGVFAGFFCRFFFNKHFNTLLVRCTSCWSFVDLKRSWLFFFSERLVVGCGFCTFGDPLNLQLVRIVQSRTHSKPFMSHSHASASCTPLSSVHFTTAPSEKKTRENQKKQKKQKKQKNQKNQRFGN